MDGGSAEIIGGGTKNTECPLPKEAEKACRQSLHDLRERREELDRLQAVQAVQQALIKLGADPATVCGDVLSYTGEAVKLEHFERYEHLFPNKRRPDSINRTFNAQETDKIGASGLCLKYYPSRGGTVAVTHPTYSFGHAADFGLRFAGVKDSRRENFRDLLVYLKSEQGPSEGQTTDGVAATLHKAVDRAKKLGVSAVDRAGDYAHGAASKLPGVAGRVADQAIDVTGKVVRGIGKKGFKLADKGIDLAEKVADAGK